MTERNSRTQFTVPDAVLGLKLPKDAATSSYATSYRHLLKINETKVDEAAFVQASHMVYGWMPKVLNIGTGESPLTNAKAAALLEQVRAQGYVLSEDELRRLKATVGNSIVGLSKLLHFLRPDLYAIWDSKVYAYVRAIAQPDWNLKVDHSDVNKIDRFLHYMEGLRSLIAKPEFDAVHAQVNLDMGYPVSKLRAAEVLMYARAPSFKESNH